MRCLEQQGGQELDRRREEHGAWFCGSIGRTQLHVLTHHVQAADSVLQPMHVPRAGHQLPSPHV